LSKLVELLSPAKNLECGIAAINHGADAVYIGAPRFGARKHAGNSLEDIATLVDYAHLFDAKVYVAFNTLLFNDELLAAQQQIHQLYEVGVDALIIQDMGILEMDLPPIPLHASTQTDNRSVEKVAFFEKIGFDQVVLARELSLDQIKAIRQQTHVKLECFVHGALCVCYSGQCYMSQAINGRSANRGECGQPCRLPYSLTNAKGDELVKNKHLLSLKDLNLSHRVGDLIDAGVYSLKIEGRLKDVDYVKNITAYYRKAIDQALSDRNDVKKASAGVCFPSFEPNPEKSFSRGFSSYFFDGRGEDIWNPDTPKSLGEKIGKVARIEKDHFVMSGDALELYNGDGLCFFNRAKELVGIRVNRVDVKKVYPPSMKEIYVGATIFRNHDQQFNKQLLASEAVRKLKISLKFEQLHDHQFQLTVTDECGVCSVFEDQLSSQPAKNEQAAEEGIRSQLSKTGGTPFVADVIDIQMNESLFIPAKELNAMRRNALDAHVVFRKKNYQRLEIPFVPTTVPYLSDKLGFKANIVNDKARLFYQRHGVESSEWGYEIIKNTSGEVMTTKHCLLDSMGMCLKTHPENKQYLPMILHRDKDRYQVTVDCKACEMHLTKI
jgi:putative protease